MTHSPYHVPRQPGAGAAIALAAAVHLALFGFLWVGVRWQSATPLAVEAEVWSPVIEEAAPVAPPQPEPEPQPQAQEPPKPVEEPKIERPDIALEQERKRREEQRKREELAEQERLKKEAELAKKKEEEKKRKEKELAEKREQERMAKIREEELRRMTAQAGTGGTGTAAASQGPRGNPEYLARVGAKIKSNTVFVAADSLSGNPAVEYAVELLPDGSIRRPIRKLRSSGVPGFDEAVLNAIEKSQPFPPDPKTGRVPNGFNIVHRPKDQ